MQFTGQQAADAVHVEKGMRAPSAVSNNNLGNVENANGAKKGGPLDHIPCSTDPPTNGSTSQPSSGRSHVEADRRKVISVEPVSDPRRFLPQTVTHDMISTVITRMPTPTEKWKNYPITKKDELFKDFIDKYRFASEYDRNKERMVWEKTCMNRYPDFFKIARKLAMKHVNSTNLADTKGREPKGMKIEI